MIKIMKVKKKPIEVNAIELTEELHPKLPIQINGRVLSSTKHGFIIQTIEGTLEAKIGDLVIIGIKGEIYPIKREIFLKTYQILGEKCVNNLSEIEKKNLV